MIALVSPRAVALAALSLMALGCADDAAPAATDAASDAVAMDAALDAPRALDVQRVTVRPAPSRSRWWRASPSRRWPSSSL